MTYRERLSYARHTLGLNFSRNPKAEALEAAIAEAEQAIAARQATEVTTAAQAEAERRTAINNDPAKLREFAAVLGAQANELDTQRRQALDRAQAIEVVLAEEQKQRGALHAQLVSFLNSIRAMVALGLGYKFPEPLDHKVLEQLVESTRPPVPPKRIFVFWTRGQYQIEKGYVVAMSFEEARQRYHSGQVDFGTSWTAGSPFNSCPTAKSEARAAIMAMTIAGTAVEPSIHAVPNRQTELLCAVLQESHIYIFVLDGSEYEGRAVVLAGDFNHAKARLVAGEVLEGDTLAQMDREHQPQLIAALDQLVLIQGKGQVERMNHLLTCEQVI